ncbi:MAG TPA: hypothetical protein DIU00_19415, partial [Phycisphaerales bacterium]|nr:hypothetical protein [Phycisphaerales bacterium]
MKQSGATIVFVIVCAAVLAAAFAAGICIREVRFSAARNEFTTAAVVEKPSPEPERSREQARPMPGPGGMDARRGLSPEGGNREQARRIPGPGGMDARGGFSPEGRGGLGDQRAGMKERLENMSDEEREQFMAQMRERFGGRRRENMPQLSEEDRAKMRKELEELQTRSEEMSDQEREEAR